MKPGIDFIGVAVGVFIINSAGQVFLTKRSKHTTNERGTWEIPGGKVNFGETLQDAAIREAKEEYDIDIEILHQFPAQNHLIPDEKQHWVPTCFICRIVGAHQPQIMEPDKCDGIGWFDFSNLPIPLSIITKIDIRQYQESGLDSGLPGKTTVKPGEYRHYKGRRYRVLGTALNSETLKEMVIYQAQYKDKHFGDRAVWVRPMKTFLEKADVGGVRIPRFELIKESNH